jgi:hypothetical protein
MPFARSMMEAAIMNSSRMYKHLAKYCTTVFLYSKERHLVTISIPELPLFKSI